MISEELAQYLGIQINATIELFDHVIPSHNLQWGLF